jgi:hypothetical protein
MKNEFDLHFKEVLAHAKEIFWAGSRPPLSRMCADERILSPQAGFRLPPDYHERFDIVYLSEVNLGSIKEWSLVVDEALRLLAPRGVLVVRMSDSHLLSIFALKHQLFCWGMAPFFEHVFADHSRLFAVRLEREQRRFESHQRDVSFGVITDGRRPLQLRKFVSSVNNLRLEPGQKVEILICGPHDLDMSAIPSQVDIRLIAEPEEFREEGWITRKKNLIVSQAAYENLVVLHDRYFFPDDFLLRLGEYGFDFGVLSCKQLTEDGNRAPDWVTLGDAWLWTPPAMLDYRDWTPFVYINGGIIIGKRRIFTQCPWNELLFWQQAEDVELTRRLQAAGHVPRLAQHVTAFSAPLRAGALESMDAIPWGRDCYVLPAPPAWGLGRAYVQAAMPDVVLDFRGAGSRKLLTQGVSLDEAWSMGDEGITLAAASRGVLAFRLAWHPIAEALSFELLVSRGAKYVQEVLINGLPAKLETFGKDGQLLRVYCPAEAFRFSPVARFSLLSRAQGAVTLAQMQTPPSNSRILSVHSAMVVSYPGSGVVLGPSDSLWKYAYAYLINHETARCWYMRLKQNEWLRSSPLARRLYTRLRRLQDKVK